MSNKIFITSDHHFGHNKILTFKNSDGNPQRNFADMDTMHDYMVEKWNSIVGPKDIVYHLGDFCFCEYSLYEYGQQLHGKKILIKGNHDKQHASDYLDIFDDIHGALTLDKFILTHIPVYSELLLERWRGNIHGHLHNRVIEFGDGMIGDKYYYMTTKLKYFNVSVELHNYTPVEFEFIKESFLQ